MQQEKCENCEQDRCWCEVIYVDVDYPGRRKYSAQDGRRHWQADTLEELEGEIRGAIGKRFRLNLPREAKP